MAVAVGGLSAAYFFVPRQNSFTVAGPPSSVPGRLSFLLGPSGRPRTSSQCLQPPLLLDALQAPLQKIDLQRLLADLALQLGDPAFGPALLAIARKDVARALAELPAS